MKNKHKIVLDYRQDPSKVEKLKAKGKKIILTQGSYDIIHVGHARYLNEAKKHGNYLIVGLDSDKKVRKRKGSGRPVVPEDERLEMLTYLKSVDLVVLKKITDPKWNLIKTVKPDVLIATKETYNLKQLDQLKKYCKKIVVLDPMAVTSTSAKIRRVQIGAAKKLESALTKKLISTIEEVLDEFKNSK